MRFFTKKKIDIYPRTPKAYSSENGATFSVIPKSWRVVPRRDERISPFFRRKTALDVRTRPIY
jgi:hypothetical protein